MVHFSGTCVSFNDKIDVGKTDSSDCGKICEKNRLHRRSYLVNSRERVARSVAGFVHKTAGEISPSMSGRHRMTNALQRDLRPQPSVLADYNDVQRLSWPDEEADIIRVKGEIGERSISLPTLARPYFSCRRITAYQSE